MEAKGGEERQQGQAEYGEIVALDGGEKPDRRSFEPIGADGAKDGLTLERQDIVALSVGEIPHQQAGRVGFRPEQRSVTGERDAAMKVVELATQAVELRAGSGEIRRFLSRKNLIIARL